MGNFNSRCLAAVSVGAALVSGLAFPPVVQAADRTVQAPAPLRPFGVSSVLGQLEDSDPTCRICGAQNGSLELTDGVFLWPEGLAHYVTAHAVRLPAAFVEHVRSFMDEIESAHVDETWWRSLGE